MFIPYAGLQGTGWEYLIGAYLGGAWMYYLTQKVYGMPVDIFEYFRKEDSTADLPVEP